MPSATTVRVRYKDTDTMSVVYYGNYLTYFAVAWVEYLRERGLPISQVDKRVHLLEIDRQLELRGLFDRQIARLGALQDLVGRSPVTAVAGG